MSSVPALFLPVTNHICSIRKYLNNVYISLHYNIFKLSSTLSIIVRNIEDICPQCLVQLSSTLRTICILLNTLFMCVLYNVLIYNININGYVCLLLYHSMSERWIHLPLIYHSILHCLPA